MPELPEVHTTTEDLKDLIVGKEISDVWSNYASNNYTEKQEIKNSAFFSLFKKRIIGTKITTVSRRGKNIVINLTNKTSIHIHLKMTGHLLFGTYTFSKKQNTWKSIEKGPLTEDPFNGFIHFVITFSDNTHLVMSDMRKFAKITLFDTENQEDYFKNIGPEPFNKSFTPKLFEERITKKPKGNIKTVLMNQEILAGVGNIYSDEALFLSKIHPETKPAQLKKGDFYSLLKDIRKVMRDGVDLIDKTRSDYRRPDGSEAVFKEKNNVYRRTNNPCPRDSCSGIIKRKIINGRSAHYCPICQKAPKA